MCKMTTAHQRGLGDWSTQQDRQPAKSHRVIARSQERGSQDTWVSANWQLDIQGCPPRADNQLDLVLEEDWERLKITTAFCDSGEQVWGREQNSQEMEAFCIRTPTGSHLINSEERGVSRQQKDAGSGSGPPHSAKTRGLPSC